MQKISIAIDIDDVLAASTDAVRQFANRRASVSLTSADYKKPGEYWGYYERVWAEHGIEGKVSFSDFEKEMAIDQLHVPLLPSADFAISQLSEKFHVVLITARNREWERATRDWFGKHLDKQDIELHFTGHRKAENYRPKGVLCAELGVSLLIDDNVDHCLSAIDHGIDAILFGEYGWQNNIPSHVVHYKEWPDVLNHINDIYDV
ncbi:MAG: hypothetical protein EOP04_13460 [Proteobacteria bacterium]|nr:MAG: hypothetical protein EOP04_13460 [Pseudomonadota bacterium]